MEMPDRTQLTLFGTALATATACLGAVSLCLAHESYVRRWKVHRGGTRGGAAARGLHPQRKSSSVAQVAQSAGPNLVVIVSVSHPVKPAGDEASVARSCRNKPSRNLGPPCNASEHNVARPVIGAAKRYAIPGRLQ
jgi:hypothetical protein